MCPYMEWLLKLVSFKSIRDLISLEIPRYYDDYFRLYPKKQKQKQKEGRAATLFCRHKESK